LNGQKEVAVAELDFERAAHLLGQADRLKKETLSRCRDWTARISLQPALFLWNAGAVPKLARKIAKEFCWDDLSSLADLLEQAGCNEVRILEHCRSGAEHGMHCWVTELLLSRAEGLGLGDRPETAAGD
jgi:hypothetical protein